MTSEPPVSHGAGAHGDGPDGHEGTAEQGGAAAGIPVHAPATRASDAEREQIAERLRDALAEGRLDMEEFDERLGAAYQARTHAELTPLVSDLPATAQAVGTAGGASPARRGPNRWAERAPDARAASSSAFAVFGGFSRKGRWTVGRSFTSVTCMGGGELDLREALFEDRVTVIRCFAFMGGVQITVPPDVDVHVQGFGFMGGFGEEEKHGEEVDGGPAPDAPRVIVKGFAFMGGVGVERKLRDADRRRLKEARRAQREEDRRARDEERRARDQERRARRDGRGKTLG